MHIAKLLFPIMVIAACGESSDGRPWAGTVDTLPTAARPMSNRVEGDWDGGPAWRLVEEVRIGSVEGTGPASFSRIVGLDVDGLGRIYVLDRQTQAVQVFDARGGHVGTIGRAGGGPGEFREANGLALDRLNRLWVVDRNRYSVFDTSGTFLTTHRREVSGWTSVWNGGFSQGGDLYDVTLIRSGAGWKQALVRYDSIVGFADTLPFRTYNVEPVTWEFTSPARRILMAVPFAPGPSWIFDPRGYIWTGLTSEYRLYQLTLTGDTIGVVQHDYQPVPVTAAERDSIIHAVRERARGTVVDVSKIPAEKPAWVRFHVDDAGYLWVMLSKPRGVSVTLFDVFEPDGRYLGSVATQWSVATFAPLLIRDAAMYTVVTDELDVPFVVRLKIEGRYAIGISIHPTQVCAVSSG